MSSFQQRANILINTFSRDASKNKYLRKLEQKTQLPPFYSASGFAALYLLIIFLNIGGIGQLFANLATLVVPGYYSLIALETPGTADDTQYLTYWVVYAAFSVVEFWSGIILYWIPLYWLFKTILFLYLGLPQFNGARLVYERVLRPFTVSVLGIRGGPASNLREKLNTGTGTSTGASTRF